MKDGNLTGTEHLDPLRLDAVRAGEGSPGEVAHLASCETCRREQALLTAIAGRLSAPLPLPEIPVEVDRRVLRAYREAMDAPPRRTFRLGWAIPAAAAAAVVVAAAVFTPALRPGRRAAPVASAPAADPGDLNRDGVIDIRDAYLLALRQPAGAPGAAANGDGLRPAEVDALARRAVALP